MAKAHKEDNGSPLQALGPQGALSGSFPRIPRVVPAVARRLRGRLRVRARATTRLTSPTPTLFFCFLPRRESARAHAPAMALPTTSPLAAAAARPCAFPTPWRCRSPPLRRLPHVSCQANRGGSRDGNSLSTSAAAAAAASPPPRWRAAVSAALAAAIVSAAPAYADLNKFEAEQRGEFGIGSAAQFGSADLKYVTRAPFPFRILSFCLVSLIFFAPCLYHCRKAVHVNENFRLDA